MHDKGLMVFDLGKFHRRKRTAVIMGWVTLLRTEVQ
jgi:hypothetical protein